MQEFQHCCVIMIELSNIANMKRVITLIAVIALSAAIPADGQNSRILENYLQIGGGTFSELPDCHTGNPLGCIQASYGLDIKIADRWSVMPAAGIRIMDEYRFRLVDGVDIDCPGFYDFSVALRYHSNIRGTEVIWGLAPVFAVINDQDNYYIDWPDKEPNLDGRKKFYPYDFGVRPGVQFLLGKHFMLGLEGYCGLRDIRIKYPELGMNDVTRIANLTIVGGFRF